MRWSQGGEWSGWDSNPRPPACKAFYRPAPDSNLHGSLRNTCVGAHCRTRSQGNPHTRVRKQVRKSGAVGRPRHSGLSPRVLEPCPMLMRQGVTAYLNSCCHTLCPSWVSSGFRTSFRTPDREVTGSETGRGYHPRPATPATLSQPNHPEATWLLRIRPAGEGGRVAGLNQRRTKSR